MQTLSDSSNSLVLTNTADLVDATCSAVTRDLLIELRCKVGEIQASLDSSLPLDSLIIDKTAFNFDVSMGDTSGFYEGFLDEARNFTTCLLSDFRCCAHAVCYFDDF